MYLVIGNQEDGTMVKFILMAQSEDDAIWHINKNHTELIEYDIYISIYHHPE